MVIVAYILRDLIAVETIVVPPKLAPSNSSVRGWFINPFGGNLSVGQGIVAVIPALLVKTHTL